ncbi:yceI like family protein [Planomonospora sphaerica]|uniref:YceI like family protein n=1 Tax=Planomonospora sphaerica TaxID=161355 RepID=A0A171DQS2_9ACTN|nr:yceI like family protein [Planomonospora sphaerica]
MIEDPGVSGPGVAPGVYRIDPGATTVRFTTRAVFGLLPVRGSFTVDHGRISITEDIGDCAVEAVIRAASFESGDPQRDEHVRSSDYLDAAVHPEIVFRSRNVGRSAEGVRVQGSLTVRGMTRPTVLALGPVITDDQCLRVRATTSVDRYAFGLTRAKGMTGRHLGITLEVTAALIGTEALLTG